METIPTISPMGTLRDVLEALSDPVRLEMVRRLERADAPIACADLYDSVSKSTASHHFKVLREAGIIDQEMRGRTRHNTLRRDHLERHYPGLLELVLRP